MQQFAFCQCVSDFEYTVVGKSDNVARPCFVNGFLALRHKLCGAGETHGLSVAHMIIGRIAHKTSRADFAESDT